MHEREEREADGLHHEARAEDRAGAEPVDERAGDQPGCQLRRSRDRDDETGDAEPEAAHAVEVDDEERQHEAVAERVREPAELQQPDLAREARVESAEVGEHRARLQSSG